VHKLRLFTISVRTRSTNKLTKLSKSHLSVYQLDCSTKPSERFNSVNGLEVVIPK
jgi:hypothetical protein